MSGLNKDESLGVGAKSQIESLAKRHVYGYEKPNINSKYLDKGILCEPQGIALYNEVFFTDLKKNTKRCENLCLTGMPDLIGDDLIVDIKCCWNLETFPELKRVAYDAAKKAGYDWQCRAYMYLFDKNHAEVAYCMVDTPDDLIKEWDDPSGHFTSGIDPAMLITTVEYERDKELENKISRAHYHAKQYFKSCVDEIMEDHS